MKSERGRFGKVLIFAVLFATLASVSIGCASATPDNTIIMYGETDSIRSLGESSDSEFSPFTASMPINAVLNIKVIDEDGNAISGLEIDLFYRLRMDNQYVSSANTDGNGVASFDVSTEMLYTVVIDPDWDNPEGAHLAYELIAIPSGTTVSDTFTTYLYTLAENETSIELRTIDGMPFANTQINISRGDSPVWTEWTDDNGEVWVNISWDDSPVWSGRTDDNGVAIVPNLAAYTRYNIDFDIPDKYCIRSSTLNIEENRRYLTAIITLHGIYGAGIHSLWDLGIDVEPDYIYPFGQSTRLMCLSDQSLEILPSDKLIYTILSHPSYDRISYEQSIEHFGSAPVELPSLPTGFYEIMTKIERDGLVKDIARTMLWIYGLNSAPNYDISIDYPLIAHDNELTIDITVSSVTEKALLCLVRTEDYVHFGYPPVHPREPWDWHLPVYSGPGGHLNLTIVVYDGPQLWYKLIEDVQAEDPNSDVQLTINISYKVISGCFGGALIGANLAVVYDSDSIWAYNPQLDTWKNQLVWGIQGVQISDDLAVAYNSNGIWAYNLQTDEWKNQHVTKGIQGVRISDNLAVVYDSDSIWAYNPQLDTWKNQLVWGIQGVQISDDLAVAYNSNGIWAYNLQTDEWKNQHVTKGIQGVRISDNLAVVYDSDSIWAYNPQLDTWKNQLVWGIQGVQISDDLAVAYNSNGIWAYNLQTDEWKNQHVTKGIQGVRISDNLAVVYDSDSIWAYNPQLDTWKNQLVWGIQGVQISDDLAVAYNSNGIWAYNLQTDEWKNQHVTKGIQGVRISDNLAVVYDSDSIWAYNPQLDTWKNQLVWGIQGVQISDDLAVAYNSNGIWAYNLQTDEWKNQHVTKGIQGVRISDNLAVVYDSDSIWAYNPQLDTWKNQLVWGIQGVQISDDLAVAYNSNGIWAYNLQTDEWKNQHVTKGIQGVRISDNLAVVYDSDSIWAYNPQLDTWKNQLVWGIQGVQISDDLAVAYNSNGIWAYNPQLDAWKRQSVGGILCPASL